MIKDFKYKSVCPKCGITHFTLGDLGKHWVAYIFECDCCGTHITLKNFKQEVKEFSIQLSSVKNVNDFLNL